MLYDFGQFAMLTQVAPMGGEWITLTKLTFVGGSSPLTAHRRKTKKYRKVFFFPHKL
jgi:hypothetical protein